MELETRRWKLTGSKAGGNTETEIEGISLKVQLSGIKIRTSLGGIAQLVERLVRNEKVWGSTPHTSTKVSSGFYGILYFSLPGCAVLLTPMRWKGNYKSVRRTHFLYLTLATILFTGLASVPVVAADYWEGLSSRQRDILSAGESLVLEEEMPGNPWPRFIVYKLVKATPAEIAAVFWDLRLDPKYIPNCLSVTITASPAPNILEGEYTLKMPFFLPDEVYVSRNTLHRHSDEHYEISWEVLRSRYTKSCRGSVDLQKLDRGTLLRYTNVVEPGSKIAGIMKNSASRQLLASVKALVSQVASETANRSELLEKQLKTLGEASGSR